MSSFNYLNSIRIHKNVVLGTSWSREDVTTERIIKILSGDEEFESTRNGSDILKFDARLLSEGRAFVSKVFRISIEFASGNSEQRQTHECGAAANNIEYTCILKVPHVRAWKCYGGRRISEFPENRFTDEEMDQVAINFHNTECQFYKLFKGMKSELCPIPNVVYLEEITEDSEGLILMENLADHTRAIGFYASATEGQAYEIARSVAFMQFFADKEELRNWWGPKVGRMYLDLFLDEFQLTGFPYLKPFPELLEMLDDVRSVFGRRFSYYSLVEKPREYGDINLEESNGIKETDSTVFITKYLPDLIHPVYMQPNNILFELNTPGDVTSNIAAVIDWQLIFAGNPLTDIAKFLIVSVDDDLRIQIGQRLFDIYYEELERHYNADGRKPAFTYQQGLELYQLSIGEQTAAMIILMGFVEQGKQVLNLDEKASRLFSRRIIDATRRLIPIIKENEWDKKFDDGVDWKKYM